MKTINLIYNENKEVEFLLSQNGNLMVNATQMANIFGKEVFDFMKNESTKKFIFEALKTDNSRFLNVNSESDLINSRQKSGTFMHRVLALKFAAWLDPKLELWIFMALDKILFESFKEQKEATQEKLLAEKERDLKKQELLEKYPEFAEFLEIENKISEADKRRARAIKESTKQLKLDLFPIN
jgi:hypothetical protein